MEFYKLEKAQQVRLLAYDRHVHSPSRAQSAPELSPEEQARQHAMKQRIKALQAKRGA